MTTLQTMRPLAVGNRSVKLAGVYVPGVSTTISVDNIDAGIILAAPNTISIIDNTVEDQTYLVTVGYTAIEGNLLTGLTVKEYDPYTAITHQFAAGSEVCNALNREDIQLINSNISALNTGKQETLVSGTNIKTINGQSVLGEGNIPITATAEWGTITGTLSSQVDLRLALEGKVGMSQGASNKNRPLVVGEDGDVTLGSRITQPHVDGECCIFPASSAGGPTVEGTTVVF